MNNHPGSRESCLVNQTEVGLYIGGIYGSLARLAGLAIRQKIVLDESFEPLIEIVIETREMIKNLAEIDFDLVVMKAVKMVDLFDRIQNAGILMREAEVYTQITHYMNKLKTALNKKTILTGKPQDGEN